MKDVMRNVAAFVDGRNHAGQFNKVTLPEISVQTEEFRAGGMDAPTEMDMGMAAMRVTLEAENVVVDVKKLMGRPDIPLTLRGALMSSDGEVRGATAELTGRFITDNGGDWEPGSKATNTFTFAANTYVLRVAGEEVYEIDVERMVRKIGGVDQLAGIRDVLGI